MKVTPDDLRIKHCTLCTPELDPRSLPQPLARMDQRDPGVTIFSLTNEKAFRRAASREAHADQSRRKHFRIVDDEDVARPEQLGKIAELTMNEGASLAVEHQQPAAASFNGRLLRDQFVRKLEIEVGNVHKNKWPGPVGVGPLYALESKP